MAPSIQMMPILGPKVYKLEPPQKGLQQGNIGPVRNPMPALKVALLSRILTVAHITFGPGPWIGP